MRPTADSGRGQLAIEALTYILLVGFFLSYGFFLLGNFKPVDFGKWRLASSVADTIVMNPDHGWVSADHKIDENKLGTAVGKIDFGFSIGEYRRINQGARACVWRIVEMKGQLSWVEICV